MASKRRSPDTRPKLVPSVRLMSLAGLLKHELSKSELHSLIASCASMSSDEEYRGEFANMLLSALVVLCTESGDRETLVTLLAGCYPTTLFPSEDTELYLVYEGGVDSVLFKAGVCNVHRSKIRRNVEWAISHGFSKAAIIDKEHAALVESTAKWFNNHKNDPGVGGKFTDPILILTDAYAKSKRRAVRENIAQAFRHAFVGLGVVGKSDDEFVKNTVTWYAKHKNHLVVNDDYALNSLTPSFDYDTNPLFKLTSVQPQQPHGPKQ